MPKKRIVEEVFNASIQTTIPLSNELNNDDTIITSLIQQQDDNLKLQKKLLRQQKKQEKKLQKKIKRQQLKSKQVGRDGNPLAKQEPKRKPNDLLKLLQKGIIYEKHYDAGERLARDYENSFRTYTSSSNWSKIKTPKSNKINTESFIFKSLTAYDNYSKALMSIPHNSTREVVRLFCCEGVGLTKIDRQVLGKMGASEVHLYYGLDELARWYEEVDKKE